MSKEQKEPDVILQEIVTDIVDNKKYRSYTHIEEWQPFFSAMNKIVKQIVKKQGGLEKEAGLYRKKYNEVITEREVLLAKYEAEKERVDKLELDNETL
jgi:hypothetical protein